MTTHSLLGSRRSLAALLALLALAGAGCPTDKSANKADTASGSAAGNASRGPDSVSGAGGKSVSPTAVPLPRQDKQLPDDFTLQNGQITVNIDAVGLDSSFIFSPAFPTGVPMENTVAPSGGNLVDISFQGVPNDQFLTNGMGVVGASSIATGLVPFKPPDNLVYWFEVIPDTSPEAALFGVTADATFRRLIVRGVIFNPSTRTGPGEAIGGTATEAAGVTKAFTASNPAIPQAFRDNVPDGFNILVHTTSAISPNQNTHIPVFVTQIYALSAGSQYLQSTTVIKHSVPGGDTVFIAQMLELAGLGALANTNLDLLAGGPLFIDPLAYMTAVFIKAGLPPATAAAQAQGYLASVAPLLGTDKSVHMARLNAVLKATGLSAAAQPSDSYGTGVAPWVSLIGRDEPGVSYTYADAAAGGLIVARDPSQSKILSLIQLRSDKTVPADVTSTAADEAAAGQLAWIRTIAVGARNDAASSADLAAQALKTFPIRKVGAPNFVTSNFTLFGRVTNMPEGTIVAISEKQPTFFNFYCPVTEIFGAAVQTPTFAGPTQPSVNLGTVTFTSIALAQNVVKTTVRPGPDGRWAVTLPDSAFVQVSSNPAVPVVNVASSTYEAKAFFPGNGTPLVFPTATATRGIGQLDLGSVDASGANLGTVHFAILDSVSGAPIPGMITILGPGGATFTADLSIPTAIEEGWERAALAGNLAMSASGEGTFPLKAGTYTFIASAGMEWEVVQKTDRLLAAGGTLDFFSSLASSFVLTKVTNVTRKAISADFHVHTGQSPDSSVPGEDRIRSFLAQGVEILAQTDHDKVGDLSEAFEVVRGERGDIGNRLHLVHGEEFTSDLGWIPGVNAAAGKQCIGHWNSFPLPFEPSLRKHGAPDDEFRPPLVAMLNLRLLDGVLVPTQLLGVTDFSNPANEIVQMNHPYASTSTSSLDGGDGFLANMVFLFGSPFGSVENVPDMSSAVTQGTFDVGIQLLVDNQNGGPFGGTAVGPLLKGTASFDTYELMIGGQDVKRYLQNRAFWFAMLNRGVMKTGTGDTDSHRIDDRASFASRFDSSNVGVPRNYLLIPDTPAAVTDGAIVTALKPTFATPSAASPTAFNVATFLADRMKSFATTGPFLDVQVVAGGNTVTDPIGRFITATGALSVTVNVTITGPTWIMDEVREVRVVLNGGTAPIGSVNTFALTPGGVTQQTHSFSISTAVPTALGADAWLVVEAGQPLSELNAGALPSPNSTYGRVYPGTAVVSFTNPIFLNLDGAAGFNGFFRDK